MTELRDGTYRTSAVTGHDLVAGTGITIGLENGTLSVRGGCNTQFGSYELVEGRLRWAGDPATTLVACAPELHAQDEWLAELFLAGMDVAVTGSTLTLTDGAVTLDLHLTSSPDAS